MGLTTEYRGLAKVLLSVEELEVPPLPLPKLFIDPPHLNIVDLTDEDEQRLCCEVGERTAMEPAVGAGLGASQRIPWMQKAVEKAKAPSNDEQPEGDDSSPAALEAAASAHGERAHSDDVTPIGLLVRLSPQERKIIEFLWDREKVTVDELESYLTSEGRTPDALRQAISRLNERLRCYDEMDVRVHLKRPHVLLTRDDKTRTTNGQT